MGTATGVQAINTTESSFEKSSSPQCASLRDPSPSLSASLAGSFVTLSELQVLRNTPSSTKILGQSSSPEITSQLQDRDIRSCERQEQEDLETESLDLDPESLDHQERRSNSTDFTNAGKLIAFRNRISAAASANMITPENTVSRDNMITPENAVPRGTFWRDRYSRNRAVLEEPCVEERGPASMRDMRDEEKNASEGGVMRDRDNHSEGAEGVIVDSSEGVEGSFQTSQESKRQGTRSRNGTNRTNRSRNDTHRNGGDGGSSSTQQSDGVLAATSANRISSTGPLTNRPSSSRDLTGSSSTGNYRASSSFGNTNRASSNNSSGTNTITIRNKIAIPLLSLAGHLQTLTWMPRLPLTGWVGNLGSSERGGSSSAFRNETAEKRSRQEAKQRSQHAKRSQPGGSQYNNGDSKAAESSDGDNHSGAQSIDVEDSVPHHLRRNSGPLSEDSGRSRPSHDTGRTICQHKSQRLPSPRIQNQSPQHSRGRVARVNGHPLNDSDKADSSSQCSHDKKVQDKVHDNVKKENHYHPGTERLKRVDSKKWRKVDDTQFLSQLGVSRKWINAISQSSDNPSESFETKQEEKQRLYLEIKDRIYLDEIREKWKKEFLKHNDDVARTLLFVDKEKAELKAQKSAYKKRYSEPTGSPTGSNHGPADSDDIPNEAAEADYIKRHASIADMSQMANEAIEKANGLKLEINSSTSNSIIEPTSNSIIEPTSNSIIEPTRNDGNSLIERGNSLIELIVNNIEHLSQASLTEQLSQASLTEQLSAEKKNLWNIWHIWEDVSHAEAFLATHIPFDWPGTVTKTEVTINVAEKFAKSATLTKSVKWKQEGATSADSTQQGSTSSDSTESGSSGSSDSIEVVSDSNHKHLGTESSPGTESAPGSEPPPETDSNSGNVNKKCETTEKSETTAKSAIPTAANNNKSTEVEEQKTVLEEHARLQSEIQKAKKHVRSVLYEAWRRENTLLLKLQLLKEKAEREEREKLKRSQSIKRWKKSRAAIDAFRKGGKGEAPGCRGPLPGRGGGEKNDCCINTKRDGGLEMEKAILAAIGKKEDKKKEERMQKKTDKTEHSETRSHMQRDAASGNHKQRDADTNAAVSDHNRVEEDEQAKSARNKKTHDSNHTGTEEMNQTQTTQQVTQQDLSC